MASETARLEINRRKILIGNLVGFIVWQLPNLFHYFTSRPLAGWGSIISAIGGLVWAYYLFRIVQFSRLLRKKRELANSLNDEYIQVIRFKSFTIGFWVLMGFIAFLMAINGFIDLNVSFVLLSSIFVGVIAILISYLVIEKD
ncbi:hypothetical protein FHS14_004620 [Paenibacillus baekrokdamisoli]|uniref:hypothetical protein n=1 Tax=Paenibacillus baekrokdamisoli TaxID=1712516 RepID=UPI000F77511E|nr:hypothetical protein [Paenibacillus baekrokdamisoli]MBB3071611.1 hypothetical protein [Paenibacillus baekrokdamisoli]